MTSHKTASSVPNKDLRRKIVDMVYRAKDGHIPSSFSIVDICNLLYGRYLKYDVKNPKSPERDYFILSKGHGCVGLYVVLWKYGFLTDHDLATFCTPQGILGEHPDTTKVPGIEASTGSLGHGLAFAVGISLGLKIKQQSNRIFTLLGDGECHEGSVWEAVHVGVNRELGKLCAIVDWNGSAATLMPKDDLPGKWRSFGWHTYVVDGHNEKEMQEALDEITRAERNEPSVVVARTVKGKGVPFVEGHGPWHHKIPSTEEYQLIMEALT